MIAAAGRRGRRAARLRPARRPATTRSRRRPADDERGYYLDDARRCTEIGPDGAPRIVLRADSIEQRLADQSVLLYDLTLDYNDRATAGALDASPPTRGRMPPDRDVAAAVGRRAGHRGSEARGTAVIRTDQLDLRHDDAA